MWFTMMDDDNWVSKIYFQNRVLTNRKGYGMIFNAKLVLEDYIFRSSKLYIVYHQVQVHLV